MGCFELVDCKVFFLVCGSLVVSVNLWFNFCCDLGFVKANFGDLFG